MSRLPGEPQWKIAFELLKKLNPGDVLPYEVLHEKFGPDRAKVRRMVKRANDPLLKEHGRQVVAVPEVGYRMLHASEHPGQARWHEQNSRRQMDQALVVIEATHLEELEPAQREKVIEYRSVLGNVVRALAYHEGRLNHHNDLIAGLQRRQEDLQGQVEQLKNQLPPEEEEEEEEE